MGKEDDEDFELESSTYDLLGIAPSYRPKNEIQAREEKEKAKPLTLKEIKRLKERNPEVWKEVYGPGSRYQKRKKERSERRSKRKKTN
jgi:hypothetical protein